MEVIFIFDTTYIIVCAPSWISIDVELVDTIFFDVNTINCNCKNFLLDFIIFSKENTNFNKFNFELNPYLYTTSWFFEVFKTQYIFFL